MTTTIHKEAKKRLPSQKETILRLLREAGTTGVTNVRLTKVALRYGAPLGALYQDGYKIETINLGDGLVKYILRGEPNADEKKKEKSTDLFEGALITRFGVEAKDDILELMDKLNLTVKYKAGTFK